MLTAVEPIVAADLWERCNALLDERKAKNGRKPAKKAVHLFAGLAYCHCGSKLYVHSNSPKYVCQKCRNKIPADDLAAVFHEQLKHFFLSPDEVAGYLSQADTTIQEKEELLGTLERDAARVRQGMDKTYRAYQADQISVEGFGHLYRPLEQRLKQLDDQLPQLQGELDFLKIQYLSRDEILDEARDLYARWPELSSTEKRQIVEHVVEKIVVGRDDVSIDLCYLPSSFELVADGQRNLMDSSPRPASASQDRSGSWPPD